MINSVNILQEILNNSVKTDECESRKHIHEDLQEHNKHNRIQ